MHGRVRDQSAVSGCTTLPRQVEREGAVLEIVARRIEVLADGSRIDVVAVVCATLSHGTVLLHSPRVCAGTANVADFHRTISRAGCKTCRYIQAVGRDIATSNSIGLVRGRSFATDSGPYSNHAVGWKSCANEIDR